MGIIHNAGEGRGYRKLIGSSKADGDYRIGRIRFSSENTLTRGWFFRKLDSRSKSAISDIAFSITRRLFIRERAGQTIRLPRGSTKL